MPNRIRSSNSQPKWIDLIKQFDVALTEIQSHRGGKHTMEIWFRQEMEDLLGLINWERAQIDKDPIPMRLLLRRETGASGHSDYSHKLAIYAAELVIDKDGGP